MEKITFKEFLKEAPLGDYQTIGNFDKAYSIKNKTDRTMITSPKAIENVRKKFGKTPYIVNMFFVNKREAQGHAEKGKTDLEWVEENLGEDVANAVRPTYETENNINVIFVSAGGAERVPMTPWIMAHRIGHALSRFNPSYGSPRQGRQFYNYQEVVDAITSFLDEILTNVYRVRDNVPGDTFGPKSRDHQLMMIHLFNELCTFKSARDKNIRDFFEVYNELVAQYIIQGKITFNPLPQQFGVKGWGRSPRYADRNQLEEYQSVVDGLENTLNYYMQQLLDEACNGVLVM